MEQFVVVITTTDQPLADRACAALEDAGIPVMLEHVEIHENNFRASGYRLMVPSQFVQSAQRLTRAAAFAFEGGHAFRGTSLRDHDQFSGGKYVPQSARRLNRRLAVN